MYNTKIVCTYHTPEVFLETDKITDDEKIFIRNVIYREEFLNILGMEEYDDKKVSQSIHELYEKIKDQSYLKECITKVGDTYFSEDKEIGLMILFSYDYMYITHICISEYLETGTISDHNIETLNTLIHF
jgi:hypothetical protein